MLYLLNLLLQDKTEDEKKLLAKKVGSGNTERERLRASSSLGSIEEGVESGTVWRITFVLSKSSMRVKPVKHVRMQVKRVKHFSSSKLRRYSRAASLLFS